MEPLLIDQASRHRPGLTGLARDLAQKSAGFHWSGVSAMPAPHRLDSIAMPCSVKAYGRYRRPPWPKLEITVCDLKMATA